MRGTPRNQAGQIFRPLNRIGQSRHRDKKAARADGLRGSHQISQATGIYSYRTLTEYRKHTATFLQWCREKHQIKDAAKVQPEHVREWLRLKMAEGVRFKTWQTYAAALNKATVGLQTIYDRDPGWTAVTYEERKLARQTLDSEVKPRAYHDAGAVVDRLSGNHRTAAQLQYLAGARVKEITRLTADNLADGSWIKLTNTKGGRVRKVMVPPDVYRKIAREIREKGEFAVDYKDYLTELKMAALETGQPYTGSHGLRWNFAQETVRRLQMDGRSYDEALKLTAEMMGHNRSDITEHYLQ